MDIKTDILKIQSITDLFSCNLKNSNKMIILHVYTIHIEIIIVIRRWR
jgi:hypothetical protein